MLCRCGNSAKQSGIYVGYCRKCVKRYCPNYVAERRGKRRKKKRKRRERQALLQREGHTVCSYSGRQRVLMLIGFKTYRTYLESELWAGLRVEALIRDNHTCRLCSRLATQVHHRDYTKKTLLGEKPSGLVSLCGDCHKMLERNEDGTKRSLIDVMKLTSNRLRETKGAKRCYTVGGRMLIA